MSCKITFFVVLLISTCYSGQAQTQDSSWYKSKRNAAYLELFGGRMLYSLNYQRIGASSTRFAFTYRIGASFLPLYGGNLTGYMGGLIGKSTAAFEFLLGAGYYGIGDATKIVFPEERLSNVYLTPQIGYRQQKSRDGFLFRATFTPWFLINEGFSQTKLRTSFGLSLGKTF